MSIEIKKIDQIKTVKKPWGYEKWIADGYPDFKYALKEILFRSGYKSSIQFHAHKEETNYILKGSGLFSDMNCIQKLPVFHPILISHLFLLLFLQMYHVQKMKGVQGQKNNRFRSNRE